MAEKFFEAGGCPADYFGKGPEFLLPDDPQVLREFEMRFQEYELAHPNDPTGEIALAKNTVTRPTKPLAIPTEERDAFDLISENDTLSEIEMVLPIRHIQLFKRYCRFQRRRPRDVFMVWIDKICKL